MVGWTPGGEILYATGHYSALPAAQLAVSIPATGAADAGAPGPGERRQLHAGRQDPLLHPLRLPGQPHQALPGRHGPEPLALPRRRRRGRAAHRRLRRHQQGADGLAGPGLLRLRPRRHDEPLVDGRDTERAGPRQHTFHTGWDVASPDLSEGRIVYQLGADLRIFDVAVAARTRPCRSSSSRTSTRSARAG